MSTYDDASLIMFPSGYKAGKAYSLKPTDGSGDLTFTRASTATRVNEQGLIEGVRTNLLLQSNTFDTTWTSVNTTETGGQAGYDGTNNAWLLEKSAAGARIVQSISLIGLQTTSLYAKAGTLNWLAFTGNGSSSAYFDLQNGVVGTVSAGATAQMVSVGGGWYRCSLSQSVTLTGVRIYAADGDLDTSGTSGSIYIQDAQLEASVQATEYIPTTTTAVSVGMLANVPRIDYTGGGCGKLLLEPQRTNLALYSNDLSNAAWLKTFTTITSNAATSPDGTTNANKIVETTDNNLHRVGQGAISVTSGQVYTFSFYAKAGERNELELQRINTSGTVFNSISLTTADLTLGTLSVGSNVTSSSINSVGNGWYRISLSLTAIATGSGGINIGMQKDGNVSYLGDGTSGVFIYGFQAEQGSFPTSIIPTTSTAVTRVADSLSNFTSAAIFGTASDSVVYFEILHAGIVNTSAAAIFRFGDAGAGLQFSLYVDNKGVNVFNYAAPSGFLINETNANGSTIKIAIRWNGAVLTGFHNGVKKTTITRSSGTYSIDRISDMNMSNLNSIGLKSMIIFPTALTDEELIALTTL